MFFKAVDCYYYKYSLRIFLSKFEIKIPAITGKIAEIVKAPRLPYDKISPAGKGRFLPGLVVMGCFCVSTDTSWE